MTKTELLKKIEPGDSAYFDFSKVTSRYDSGWYEYVGLKECDNFCTFNNGQKCPGGTKFKGLDSECLVWSIKLPASECLVWSKQMPTEDIRKIPKLPDELFEIEI